MYIFIIFFLIFLLDFIVTINIIQLLATILIRINYFFRYLSIYLPISPINCEFPIELASNRWHVFVLVSRGIVERSSVVFCVAVKTYGRHGCAA